MALDTQRDKLEEPAPERGGPPRPLKLGTGVGRRACGAALPAALQHFQGGGAWGGALAGKWEGVARDASWSCICRTSHPLYLGDNAREARRGGGGGLEGFVEVLALKGHLGRFHTTCFPTSRGALPHCSALGRGQTAGAAARGCVWQSLCVLPLPLLPFPHPASP